MGVRRNGGRARADRDYSVAITVANVTIALILLRCVARPPRWLEHPVLRWIGALSYSLYLWQQLFLNRHSDGWAQQFPINVVLAIAAAVVCHYLIERPFLRLSAFRTDRLSQAPRMTGACARRSTREKS